ncbi:Uncharacterized mitochondrial protein AtMg00310 [Linum perenne]
MLSLRDKKGGVQLSRNAVSPLLDFSNNLGLIDIGFSGEEFTWSNRQSGASLIEERLDRFFFNDLWLSLFPESHVRHLFPRYSDHSPILLRTQPPSPISKKLFRFDCRWVENPEVTLLIQHTWSQPCRDGSPMFRLADKLKSLRHTLFDWCRGGTSNSARLLQDIDRALTIEYSIPARNWDEIRRLESLRSQVRLQEEIYWKQKARINWLASGDRNTSFFHKTVSATRKRNLIGDLRNSDGSVAISEHEKGRLAVSYFKGLFSSEHDGTQESVSDLGISAVITPQMNMDLMVEVSDEDIRLSVFSIGPTQAPGPDGFTGLFFQRYWHIIADDVCCAVKDFFRRGHMLRTLNHTWLTLIPKTSEVENMTQIRPIGLCTVFYKIISKIITNRLGKILPHFVNPAQNGFVQGRCITDNILIAHELIHHLQSYVAGGQHFMAVKVDMEKAYDRVEWDFLFPLLHILGFRQDWISLVHSCLSSATMEVLLNGNPHGYFAPTRGLRQGDPLSPLLFAICTEGLSHLLHLAVSHKHIHGIKLNSHCPVITHLMFADDTMLFLKATRPSLVHLKALFTRYQLLSGQRINYSKSSILFSKNVPRHLRIEYSRYLQIEILNASPNYLGAPCVVMKSKKETFRFLEDRVTTRLHSWKRQSLSPAGVHTLLTSVISGLPVHIMSCYRVSNTVCSALDALMSKFWWGEVGDQRKIKWRSWKKLCTPQDDGGLGFRDFQSFNQALLAKQSWRILTEPNLLLSRVLKGRYFPSSNFLNATKRSHPSWGWQSILFGRDLLLPGLIWQIGLHTRLYVLERPWIPGPNGPSYPAPMVPVLQLRHVQISSLFLNGGWDFSKLREFFDPISVQAIGNIPLPQSLFTDKPIWFFSPSGRYSVSSGYDLACRYRKVKKTPPSLASTTDPRLWRSIWSLRIQPKLRFFLWRLCHRILPTIEGLNSRDLNLDPICPSCLEHNETVEHILFSCSIAKRFFAFSDLDLGSIPHTHPAIVWRFITEFRPLEAELWVLAWWRLWKSRNWVVFERVQYSMAALQRHFTFDQDKLRFLPIPTPPATAPSSRDLPWQAPRYPRLKINVDGAVADGAGGATGLVVRDSSGGQLFASGISYPGISSPFILELLAVRDACALCHSMGWREVDIEGDATQVSLAVAQRQVFSRDGGAIVADILHFVDGLPQLRLRSVPRQSNMAAHYVARQALSYLPSQGVVNLSAWGGT